MGGEERNGNLASIHNMVTNDWIYDKLNAMGHTVAWIGLNREDLREFSFFLFLFFIFLLLCLSFLFFHVHLIFLVLFISFSSLLVLYMLLLFPVVFPSSSLPCGFCFVRVEIHLSVSSKPNMFKLKSK